MDVQNESLQYFFELQRQRKNIKKKKKNDELIQRGK